MKKMMHVVKRNGYKERFDERKVYSSVYAACASAQFSQQRCEKVAKGLTDKIKKIAKNKKEISSIDIRKKVIIELKKKNKELAFFYEQHLPNLKQL